MKNRWKIALSLGAMVGVLAIGEWIDATPRAPVPSDYAPGTLARAVMDHCDANRAGAFIDDSLDDAVTCRDLAAQENMALSTQRLVWLSWLQIIVAIGGAATVLWTVAIAIRSMDLTRKALQHQQVIDRLQLRPKLVRRRQPATFAADGSCKLEIDFYNAGHISALNYRKGMVWEVKPKADKVCNLGSKVKLRKNRSIVPPMSPAGWLLPLSASQVALVKAGTHVLKVFCIFIYDDELGGRYRGGFSKTFHGVDLKEEHALSLTLVAPPEFKGRSI